MGEMPVQLWGYCLEANATLFEAELSAKVSVHWSRQAATKQGTYEYDFSLPFTIAKGVLAQNFLYGLVTTDKNAEVSPFYSGVNDYTRTLFGDLYQYQGSNAAAFFPSGSTAAPYIATVRLQEMRAGGAVADLSVLFPSKISISAAANEYVREIGVFRQTCTQTPVFSVTATATLLNYIAEFTPFAARERGKTATGTYNFDISNVPTIGREFDRNTDTAMTMNNGTNVVYDFGTTFATAEVLSRLNPADAVNPVLLEKSTDNVSYSTVFSATGVVPTNRTNTVTNFRYLRWTSNSSGLAQILELAVWV